MCSAKMSSSDIVTICMIPPNLSKQNAVEVIAGYQSNNRIVNTYI